MDIEIKFDPLAELRNDAAKVTEPLREKVEMIGENCRKMDIKKEQVKQARLSEIKEQINQQVDSLIQEGYYKNRSEIDLAFATSTGKANSSFISRATNIEDGMGYESRKALLHFILRRTVVYNVLFWAVSTDIECGVWDKALLEFSRNTDDPPNQFRLRGSCFFRFGLDEKTTGVAKIFEHGARVQIELADNRPDYPKAFILGLFEQKELKRAPNFRAIVGHYLAISASNEFSEPVSSRPILLYPATIEEEKKKSLFIWMNAIKDDSNWWRRTNKTWLSEVMKIISQ